MDNREKWKGLPNKELSTNMVGAFEVPEEWLRKMPYDSRCGFCYNTAKKWGLTIAVRAAEFPDKVTKTESADEKIVQLPFVVQQLIGLEPLSKITAYYDNEYKALIFPMKNTISK